MSEESSNEQEDGLSKYYKFETEDEKQAYAFERAGYFSKVQALIPRVSAARAKMDAIREELKKKIKMLEEQLKARQQAPGPSGNQKSDSQGAQPSQSPLRGGSNDENSDGDLLIQDLNFCKGALVSGASLAAEIDGSRNNLELIVSTQEKRPYRAIVDVALLPLPSDRAKNKEKDKDRNKNNNQGKGNANNGFGAGKGQNASSGAPTQASSRLDAKGLKGLRNGQSLESQRQAEGQKQMAPARPQPQQAQQISPTQLYQASGGRC